MISQGGEQILPEKCLMVSEAKERVSSDIVVV